MIGAESERTTAGNYRRFAELEVRGKSSLYEELAAGVADDDEVLALIDSLPPGKRQPNLVLAAARFTSGTPSGYRDFRSRLVEQWPRVRSLALSRSTQTNEVGRCAAVAPLLAELPQPLALLELGASAGLCLRLDRYRYDYALDDCIGPARSPVTLSCELRGEDREPPPRLPRIAWAAGMDLDPVEVTDPDAVRWLEALVWPGRTDRLHRLRAAVGLATDDPPRVVRGDLRTDLPHLLAEVPRHTTPVILHSAVLAYLAPADRRRFAERVSALDAVRIGYEAPGVIPLSGPVPPAPTGNAFLITRDGRPAAWADPHGAWLHRI